MGLTMCCNGMELTMGYFHFKFLRDEIAKKVGKEYFDLHNEPFEKNMYFTMDKEKQKVYFADHAKRQLALNKKLKVPKLFQRFMWACDVEGKCTPRQSAIVLRYAEKITAEEQKKRLGYAGDPDATIQYFIELLKESIKTKEPITWS